MFVSTNPGDKNESVMIIQIKNDRRKILDTDKIYSIIEDHKHNQSEIDSEQINSIIKGDICVNRLQYVKYCDKIIPISVSDEN